MFSQTSVRRGTIAIFHLMLTEREGELASRGTGSNRIDLARAGVSLTGNRLSRRLGQFH